MVPSPHESSSGERDRGRGASPSESPQSPQITCMSVGANLPVTVGLAVCILVLSCRGPSTGAELHQRLAGIWITQPDREPAAYKNLTLSPAGNWLRTATNGVTEAIGTWQVETNLLVLTMAKTNYWTNRLSGKNHPLPLVTRYNVVRASKHNLVLTEAGPLTLFDSNDEAVVSFTAARAEIRFQR
jgi:hypothetical protein